MTDKALAKKHFAKAFDYYFKRSRRAIKEARAAIVPYGTPTGPGCDPIISST